MSEVQKVKKAAVAKDATYPLIAVVRVRGNIHNSEEINYTFKLLNIDNQNTCAILEGTPSIVGMLHKVKDFVTWGKVTSETIAKLNEVRKSNKENVYKLSPPLKGFGRKGIKKPFVQKGALGDRKDKINDLIMRMI